jgi:hypothetical protein
MAPNTNIFVKGTFISLGTQANPVVIHPCGVTKTDNTTTQPVNDAAWSTATPRWGGINCDTSCKKLILKWTRLEFCGAAFTGANATAISGITSGNASYGILFQNPAGYFDLEDCWLYGTMDDGIRVQQGMINVMRNTFEKTGYAGGEALNCKGGTQGDIAYNLFVGAATNGSKASNKKAPKGLQTNLNMYNNTYVDCGFRQASPTNRGGAIDYEGNAKGACFNNILVDCRVGVRIVNVSATGDGPADTVHMTYGNNYSYVDSVALANMIYPIGDLTHPLASDIPDTSLMFGHKHYNEGQTYNGSKVVGINNPMFASFSLPNANYRYTSYVGSASFKLMTGSPAIGKGSTTGLTPLALMPVNANYGATEITAPGADMGCYQSNGKGNQH